MKISSTIATVISVIIPAIISIISITINWKAIKATKEQNMEINNAQIDAQLVWSTQIDKIQKIRQSTAEFISACYNYMFFSGSFFERHGKLQITFEKLQLFILYFEPDTLEDNYVPITDFCDPHIIAQRSNNIIALAQKIVKLLPEYPTWMAIYNEELASYRKCSVCLSSAVKQNCIKCNLEGDDIPYTPQECENNKKLHAEKCQVNFNKISYTQRLLELLSNTMQIYLKIEMDQVRTRKKENTHKLN